LRAHRDLAERPCPQCGKKISADDRWVLWCEHCEWNLEPAGEKEPSPRDRRRWEAARLRGERLFAELKGQPVRKPDLSGAGIAAIAIAIAIHALTLAVFALGVFVLVANFPSFFGFFAGALLLLVALLIRPRLGDIERGTVLLPRDAAPAMYDLCDRVARDLGAKPVAVIAFNTRFNASHGLVGIARRRVLWIGLPLWNVLGDDARVALLAHELAHQVNGDLSFGTVVGSALNTLAAWHSMLRPGTWQPGRGSIFSFFESLGQLLARGLYRVLRSAVGALYDFEQSLLFRSGQRAEYYADRVAAHAAGTPAMLALLDSFHLGRACMLAIRYAAQRDEGDPWAAERGLVRDFNPKEWERLRRLDARRGTAVDATHPPTNLRAEMLETGPQESATIEVAAAQSVAIVSELESAYRLVGEQIASPWAG
jgi:Zn-dependent protease with chaperone function